MDLGLEGARALITGGSRGIGLATAKALVNEGARVALCARDAEGVESAVEGLGGGDSARGWAVDAGEPSAVSAWVEDAQTWLGGADILITCATAGLPGTNAKAWQAHLDVDLIGLVTVTKALLPALEKSDVASITTVGTTSAVEQFGPGISAYNACKAAVINYTAGMSQAYAPRGIRVNCVSPGPIFIEGGSWELVKTHQPEVYEHTLASCPFRRMGRADEVARAIAFLASPAASYISGENLVVDGAFTRRVAF